jgi:hypothetical protein
MFSTTDLLAPLSERGIKLSSSQVYRLVAELPERLSLKILQNIGLHPRQARSTALFILATELPAAILARMLGIHISVAVQWQRASADDWMTYAADVSRRSNKQTAIYD